jgi:sugar lactone lactonase YvrE
MRQLGVLLLMAGTLTAVGKAAVGGASVRAAPVATGPPGHVEPKLRFLAGGPEELTLDPAGNIYSSDCEDAFVFRASRRGTMTIVAGTGTQGFSGDGGSALKAEFACPSGVALDANGNLYIADHGNNRVRRIDRNGVVHSFAGAGPIPPAGSNYGSFGGDGGPAAHARFHVPTSVAFDNQGNLYVADRDNGAVREIGRDGRIRTIAGTGTRGYSGDGGPAVKARLNQPQGFAFDKAGNLYISDSANNRVRRIDRSGTITTVAGNGRHGYSGDGGPATKARLSDPYGLAFDANGNLYVAEPDEGVVRRIDAKGIITTFAGTGTLGFSGDHGPAKKAKLNNPFGLVFDAAGNLYIADNGNGRIRRVDPQGVITTFLNGR